MKKTFLLLLALSFVKVACAAPVSIAGTVRDGTNGKKPLANAEVQLVQPEDGSHKTVLATTLSDVQGRYRFPAREYGGDQLLMVNVPYQQFGYWAVAWDGGNKLQQIGLNVNPQKVDVEAYQSTTQAISLLFSVHHLAITATPEGLNCIERIVVMNPTKRTLLGIGPNKVSVWLNLPQGAQDVKLDPKIADAKLVKTSSGWGVVKPIMPASYVGTNPSINAIIINYKVKWPSSLPWAKTIDLSRDVAYKTQFFFVARTTEDKALKVTAPSLGADQEQQLPVDGKTETRLVNAVGAPSMPGMAPSGPAALSPASGRLEIEVSRPVSATFWGFAAMTVALCLFLPLALIRPRGPKTPAKSRERESFAGVYDGQSAPGTMSLPLNGFGTNLALNSQERDLIGRIADLDDLFEAGKIDEAEYREQRAARKKELLDALAMSQRP